jgi:hypothetical protein
VRSEDTLSALVDFAEKLGVMTGLMETELDSADPGEEAGDRELPQRTLTL